MTKLLGLAMIQESSSISEMYHDLLATVGSYLPAVLILTSPFLLMLIVSMVQLHKKKVRLSYKLLYFFPIPILLILSIALIGSWAYTYTFYYGLSFALLLVVINSMYLIYVIYKMEDYRLFFVSISSIIFVIAFYIYVVNSIIYYK